MSILTDRCSSENTRLNKQLTSSREKRLRIVYCLDSFEVGGTELNAVRTLEAIDRDRLEFLVIYLQSRGPLRARYEAMGIQMIHFPIGSLYSLQTVRAGWRIAKLLRAWQADVVVTHDLYTNIFVTPWARLLTRSAVVASKRWWFDSPRPGLTTVNRFSYRFAHAVLANSESVAKLLIEHENVPKQKVFVVPNFLSDSAFVNITPTERARIRSSYGAPDSACLVGIVARLVPVKNHELLLRAAALLGDQFYFVLIGDGSLRRDLESLASRLGIESRVRFTGQLSTKTNLHAGFDISVLCSTTEGFPNAVIEGMAAGCAVIATPVGGVIDVIEHGVTGLLLQESTPQALANAIRLLGENTSLRSRLAETAKLAVQNKYHQTIVTTSLVKTLNKIANDFRP